MPGVTPEIMGLAAEIRGTVGQLHRRLRQVDNGAVLTPSQTALLVRLHREGPSTPGQLAAAERVRQQSIGPILAALDELGYLERSRDPKDGRRVVISLSALGDKAVRGLLEHREEWIAEALTTMTPSDRVTLAKALPVLQKLIQH